MQLLRNERESNPQTFSGNPFSRRYSSPIDLSFQTMCVVLKDNDTHIILLSRRFNNIFTIKRLNVVPLFNGTNEHNQRTANGNPKITVCHISPTEYPCAFRQLFLTKLARLYMRPQLPTIIIYLRRCPCAILFIQQSLCNAAYHV